MSCMCGNSELCDYCSTKWCSNCYKSFRGIEHQCNPSDIVLANAIKEQKKIEEERSKEFLKYKMMFKGIKIK